MIYILGDPTDFCYAYDYFISILSNCRKKIHFVICQDREKISKWFQRQVSQYENHRYLFLGDDYGITIEDPKHVFILNTKKLSDPIQKNKIETFSQKYKIVDFSLGNTQLVPAIYLPYQVNRVEIRNMPKTNHICFVGNRSPNRDAVLNHPDLNVVIINDWQRSRDLELFQYKILLNIHMDDSNRIHEEMRVNRCVMNQMIVVSEPSDNDHLLYLKDYIVFCSRDQMVSKVQEILSDYDNYHSQLFANFDIQTIKEHYKEKMTDAWSQILE
jgi:hypothetical protein